MLPLQGVRVPSLVGELRSRKDPACCAGKNWSVLEKDAGSLDSGSGYAGDRGAEHIHTAVQHRGLCSIFCNNFQLSDVHGAPFKMQGKRRDGFEISSQSNSSSALFIKFSFSPFGKIKESHPSSHALSTLPWFYILECARQVQASVPLFILFPLSVEILGILCGSIQKFPLLWGMPHSYPLTIINCL